jgi:hypothetical protein
VPPAWLGRGLAAAAIVAAALAAALVLLALWVDLGRAGYSPDEEFTRFAVRGIHAHGLPLLPSGLLYDRGLAYSYLTALASQAARDSLVAGRMVSLACALGALILLFTLLRGTATAAASAFAAVLAAASLPFWVSATTARFYAPFLLAYIVVLALLTQPSLSWRALAPLALAAAVSRWTHELAFTLAAVPAIVAVLTRGANRRAWIVRTTAVVAGLAAGQAALLALHALAPPSNGDVMVRRFFVWQVLNLLERPPLDLPAMLPAAAFGGAAVALGLAALRARVDLPAAALIGAGGVGAALGQLAIAPVLVLAALPLVPGVAGRLVPVALAVAAAGAGFWAVALGAAGVPPSAALGRVADSGAVYPLDMFAHMVRETPFAITVVLLLLLARGAGRGGPWPARERALHALWIGWVLWFGVIESGITARYLLLPVTFLLCAIGVDSAAVLQHGVGIRSGRVAPVLAAALAAVLTLESWAGVSPDVIGAWPVRPTFSVELFRGYVQPDDLVAGHDELATLTAAGRIDAWLGLDPFYRERFIVMRGAQPTGTYTGAPAAFELTPLLARATREGRRLMIVDVIKDMPGFGSTAQLVPRQLAAEDLRAEVVADGRGVRLLHVTAPPIDAVALARPARPGR